MLRVLAVLLALCCAAHSEESSPPESKGKAEAAQGDNQRSNTSRQITVPANSNTPTIINMNTGKYADEESRCTKPKVLSAKDWREWSSFAWCRSNEWLDAEKAIAIFTGILAIASLYLWLATRKLVREAKDTSRRQLRAYLSVTPKGIVTHAQEDRFLQVHLEVKNHGQTPAYAINHVFGIDFMPNPLPEDFKYPPASEHVSHEASLFPDGSMKVWFNFNRLLSSDEIGQLETNRLRLHVWGKTFYSTVFGPNHYTNFVGSVGGPDFVANLRATRRKQGGPSFDWTWGPGHGSGDKHG